MMADGRRQWKPARATPADEAALRRLFAECSMQTIVQRFFAPLREFPRTYLNGVLTASPTTHDAVVVRYGDGLHVAAVASFVRSPDDPSAGELGVLVSDAWQRRGLGEAMVRVLVARAVDRGTERMSASVLPHRAALLEALERYGRRTALESTPDHLTGHFALPMPGDPACSVPSAGVTVPGPAV